MCASVFVSLSFLCMFIKLNLPLFWITNTYYHHVMIHKVKGPWDIANKSAISQSAVKFLIATFVNLSSYRLIFLTVPGKNTTQ